MNEQPELATIKEARKALELLEESFEETAAHIPPIH